MRNNLSLFLVVAACISWPCLAADDIAALSARAEKGEALAQYRLGYDYVWGFGVKKSDAKAVAWWRKSAEQGYAPAEFMLGNAYDEGRAMPEDDAQAVVWLQKAADHDDAKAKFLLAKKYEFEENGLRQDHDKAQKYWNESIGPLRAAAEKGEVEAQCDLGLAYLRGWGVAKDPEESLRWMLRAADTHHPMGQTVLAVVYQSGVGDAPRNDAEAAKLFEMAAEQNSNLAQLELGRAYEKGVGVPKDSVKAYMWLDIALLQGKQEAGPFLVGTSKTMTLVQVQDATKRAHDWLAQHVEMP